MIGGGEGKQKERETIDPVRNKREREKGEEGREEKIKTETQVVSCRRKRSQRLAKQGPAHYCLATRQLFTRKQ